MIAQNYSEIFVLRRHLPLVTTMLIKPQYLTYERSFTNIGMTRLKVSRPFMPVTLDLNVFRVHHKNT